LKRTGRLSQIWRYPIKGLGGESIPNAMVARSGIVGDRAYLFRDTDGKILGPVPKTGSQRKVGTLGFRARLHESSQVSVFDVSSGKELTNSDDPDFSERMNLSFGVPTRLEGASSILVTRTSSGRAIHVITDSSIRGMKKAYPKGDFDVRRFRPNLLVSTLSGTRDFEEERWVGGLLRIGSATLRVEEPNARCVVTTLGQGRLPKDEKILETITKANKGCLGVMCSVEQEGSISAGDDVFLDGI